MNHPPIDTRPKLVSLDERRRVAVVSQRKFQPVCQIGTAVHETALGRVFTNEDGSVILLGQSGTTVLTPTEADAIGKAFRDSAHAGHERHAFLAGKKDWTIVERKGDLVLVRHAPWRDHEAQRWFERFRIGKRKRGAWRCDACRGEIEAGSLAWREHAPKAYAEPNWRDHRFHIECFREGAFGLRVVK